jgi:hemoglobin-like flavoprotein
MNTAIASRVWDHILQSREPLTQRFYSRLFREFPQYRSLFDTIGEPQRRKLVGTFGIAACTVDDTEIVHPHLMRIGKQLSSLHLNESDLVNFQNIFVKSLADCCGENWTTDCEKAWNELFETHLIPNLNHGLIQ